MQIEPFCIHASVYTVILYYQAALLLVNLTSESLPTGTTENDYKTCPGPVVMDTEYGVSLVGLTALLALLHHCQFYREMTILLSSYYPQPNIQPAVTSEVCQLSASNSENTLSMLGKGTTFILLGHPQNCGWALRFALLRTYIRPSARTSVCTSSVCAYNPKSCVRNSSYTLG